jgi:rfaE bifunctional protein nucleotidyltransferase chain/domain
MRRRIKLAPHLYPRNARAKFRIRDSNRICPARNYGSFRRRDVMRARQRVNMKAAVMRATACKFSAATPSMGKILSQDELILLTTREKRNGRRVVFTNGCFDLLHPGHVRCLAEARALGDLLVVAVNSDRSVRGNKGPERPLVPQQDRAEVLAALSSVDYVTVFDEPTPRELIARVLPSVLVKGADWGPNEVAGREEVEAAGGRVVSIPLTPGYSTTSLLQRIRKAASALEGGAADRHT